MKQSPLSFVAEIHSSQKKSLVDNLMIVNEDIEKNPIITFEKIKSVHFARFIVLEEVKDNGKQKFPPYLVFFSNYDGDLDDHLSEIINTSKEGFIKIFQVCKGFPQQDKIESYISFIKEKSKNRAYFYRGTWGRSVGQIAHEESARKHVEEYLDSNENLREMPLGYVFEKIKKSLNETSLLKKYPKFSPPEIIGWKRILSLFFVGIIILLLSPLILIWIIALRMKELTDSQQEEIYSELKSTRELKGYEDFVSQNQITHLVDVKPGFIRTFTLRFVLESIYLLARIYFNKGKLGNITSIHFARWVLIDNGKRLLFASNYDGSWESYLGDFVDRAAFGLTAVWSNTVGFPKSKFLIFKGAQDEQRFKTWTRRNQIKTHVWYSAYKNLSVKNINNNTAINEGLFETPQNERQNHLNRY